MAPKADPSPEPPSTVSHMPNHAVTMIMRVITWLWMLAARAGWQPGSVGTDARFACSPLRLRQGQGSSITTTEDPTMVSGSSCSRSLHQPPSLTLRQARRRVRRGQRRPHRPRSPQSVCGMARVSRACVHVSMHACVIQPGRGTCMLSAPTERAPIASCPHASRPARTPKAFVQRTHTHAAPGPPCSS